MNMSTRNIYLLDTCVCIALLKKSPSVSMYFLYVLPLLAVASEFMQFVGLLPGTFDIMDLVSYISATILFVIIKKL